MYISHSPRLKGPKSTQTSCKPWTIWCQDRVRTMPKNLPKTKSPIISKPNQKKRSLTSIKAPKTMVLTWEKMTSSNSSIKLKILPYTIAGIILPNPQQLIGKKQLEITIFRSKNNLLSNIILKPSSFPFRLNVQYQGAPFELVKNQQV